MAWYESKIKGDQRDLPKSLPVYYLTIPKNAKHNQRAVYAPREDQKNNKEVLETIKLRASIKDSSKVYK